MTKYKRTDTIFITSENNKTADQYRLRLNLANKVKKEVIDTL